MNGNQMAYLRKSVALAALLLLAATASGCGVGLPTQPGVDAGAVSGREAGAARAQEMIPSQEMDDSSTPGGGSDGAPPPPPDEEIITQPGPGNSDWGHSHKKPGF